MRSIITYGEGVAGAAEERIEITILGPGMRHYHPYYQAECSFSSVIVGLIECDCDYSGPLNKILQTGMASECGQAKYNPGGPVITDHDRLRKIAKQIGDLPEWILFQVGPREEMKR